MTATIDQYGDSPRESLRDWTAEERLALGYHRSVDRLMGDYQSSYSPGLAKQEWLMAPGGENDPYSGPFYRTAAEAQAVADYHQDRAEAASAALPAADAALRAATGRLDELRSELASTWPWQRRRREQLRTQISDADSLNWDCYSEFSRLESAADWSAEQHYHAARIAGVLGRHERARHAAADAAARTLGWRPGQAPGPWRQRQPVPMPGSRGPGTRARSTTADALGTAAAPLLMPPPSQAPPGPIPSP